jgi:hypothetical protein
MARGRLFSPQRLPEAFSAAPESSFASACAGGVGAGADEIGGGVAAPLPRCWGAGAGIADGGGGLLGAAGVCGVAAGGAVPSDGLAAGAPPGAAAGGGAVGAAPGAALSWATAGAPAQTTMPSRPATTAQTSAAARPFLSMQASMSISSWRPFARARSNADTAVAPPLDHACDRAARKVNRRKSVAVNHMPHKLS